jgi:two-component system sensor histidine kinase/response regulator
MIKIRQNASGARMASRILMVDDNPLNFQLVCAALARKGCEVIKALNGRKALEMASSAKPDLILLDVKIPDMDGFEVCRHLCDIEAGSNVPIIFLSNAEDRETIARALSVGGADFIAKPFNPAELRWRVRVQLTLRSMLKELRGLAAEQEEQLGILAHDLKSLLGGINLSAKLCGDRLAGGKGERPAGVAAIIAASSARLLGFVQDFLAANARNSPGIQSSTNVKMPCRRSARILVADGSAHTMQVARGALGRLGHEVISAADGAALVQEVKLNTPDLILLDTDIPGEDGLKSCARIRNSEEGRNVPVIFISDSRNKESVVQAFEAGAFDYIPKPFHPEELTLRVETQLALKFERDRLMQLTDERDRLLGLLAREFEIRLATLRYNASSLREQTRGIEDARAVLMANNIEQATSQLFDYVGRFLDEAGGKHLAFRPGLMSLRRAITRTMDWYLEPARAKEVRLLLEASDEEEGVVVADEQGVNRVLDNLLSNAIKFSPPRTTVRLSIRSTSRIVQCRIADQGPGFTATDKARMFERYGRLSAQPTGEESSTGLGLSIVRKLARAMGGDVRCHSVPGRGAAFTVGFPRPSIGPIAP